MIQDKPHRSQEPLWRDLLQAMVSYTDHKFSDEPIAEIYRRGLSVFTHMPGTEQAILYTLNQESFHFHFNLALPESGDSHETLFTSLVEDGAIAAVLASGTPTVWELKQNSPNASSVFLVPLIGFQGVIGIVVVKPKHSYGTFEQLLFGLVSLHASYFAGRLYSAKLQRELTNVQSGLEQRIAVRTQSIKQSRRELQTIIDSVQSGIIVFDRELQTILDANQLALEMIGLPKEAVIGTLRDSYFYEKDREPGLKSMLSENRTGECFLKNSSGDLIPVLHRIAAVSLGGQEHFIESFFNITEMKMKESALKSSESRFRTIFEEAGSGIVLTDFNGNIIESNHTFCEMVGFTLHELQARRFPDLIHPEDFLRDSSTGDQISEWRDWEETTRSHLRFIHQDKSTIWGSFSLSFIHSGEGFPIYGIVLVENITALKQHETTLLEQTLLLNGIADATAMLLTYTDYTQAIVSALQTIGKSARVDRVYIFENSFDEQTDLLFMNQRFEWTRSSDQAEIDNPILQNLSYKAFFPRWQVVLAKGESISGLVSDFPACEQEILVPQNIISMCVVPIINNGFFWGFIGFDDCSNSRIWTQAEIASLKTLALGIGGAIQRENDKQEMFESRRRAEEANKLKTALLTNLSHELRTPLNGIFGFSQILQDELSEPEHVQMVTNIVHSSNRLTKTLNALLNLSELESGTLKPSVSEIDLTAHTGQIMRSFEAAAAAKNLDFRLSIIMENVYVFADQHLFHEILANLIDNAIKYTLSGSVHVEIDADEQDSSKAVIRVIDTGIGIENAKQEVIFYEFRQESEGLSRRFEGTGLGLTIAKKMVDLLHGSISVESDVTKGSVFILRLPCKIYSSEMIEAQAFQNETSLFQEEETPAEREYADSGSLPSVLLVEDNLINKELIEIYLKGICTLDYASEGSDAVLLAQEKPYRTVLIDINLGEGIDGIQTMFHIKQLKEHKKTPMVAVTGMAMMGDRDFLLNKGFDYYLAKPFTRFDLVKLVTQILHN